MGLVLDEPTFYDEVFHENGFDIIIEKSVLSRMKGVEIIARPNQWIGTEFLVKPISPTGSSC